MTQLVWVTLLGVLLVATGFLTIFSEKRYLRDLAPVLLLVGAILVVGCFLEAIKKPQPERARNSAQTVSLTGHGFFNITYSSCNFKIYVLI